MFRFSIRELMLVTLVVAVSGAWWVDRHAQASGAEEWKYYATCLEELLRSEGLDIRRGRKWVRATRSIPCMGNPGDQTNVQAENPNALPPSEIDPEFIDPFETTAASPVATSATHKSF